LLLKDNSSVYCYNKKEKLFGLTNLKIALSQIEELKPDYTVKMVDTLTNKSQENLLLISKKYDLIYFRILKINLRNGKRLPGTVLDCWPYLGEK